MKNKYNIIMSRYNTINFENNKIITIIDNNSIWFNANKFVFH